MTSTLSADSLYATLGLPSAPYWLDVRSKEEWRASARFIPGARFSSESIEQLGASLPRSRPLVLYDAHGTNPNSDVMQRLTALGFQCAYLEGGFDGWLNAGRSTVRVREEFGVPGRSQWITRERPKIDRLACPWLVRRFIDPDALFFYTPAHRVRTDAATLNAEPYDIADVKFSHRGARCSFDAFIDEFDLRDPVIELLADVVRAADTGELANSAQAPGLVAISLGLAANIADDVVLLEQAMPLYDALYAWCKHRRDAKHAWPQKAF